MIGRSDFKRIDKYLYEIPRSYRQDMRVPAHFFADPILLEGVLGDKSLEQLVNTATLPGIINYALAMPDIHQGYGFPIGGVVATEWPDGVISPGEPASSPAKLRSRFIAARAVLGTRFVPTTCAVSSKRFTATALSCRIGNVTVQPPCHSRTH